MFLGERQRRGDSRAQVEFQVLSRSVLQRIHTGRAASVVRAPIARSCLLQRRARQHPARPLLECRGHECGRVLARSPATKAISRVRGQTGLLRGACHRAALSPTRWLAMDGPIIHALRGVSATASGGGPRRLPATGFEIIHHQADPWRCGHPRGGDHMRQPPPKHSRSASLSVRPRRRLLANTSRPAARMGPRISGRDQSLLVRPPNGARRD